MRRKAWMLLAAALMGLLAVTPARSRAAEMSLMVFNVGKADCLLLRSGEDAYLIDTARGKNWKEPGLEEQIRALGVEKLTGVIITHMDSDHVGGLKKMLKAGLEPEHIYVPAFFLPEKEGEENPAVKQTEKLEMEVESLRGGDEIALDGGTLRVLGPLRAATDKEDNNSLVLYAEAAGGSMLLAGDMEFPEEEDLLQAGVIPPADVLKVGNHGDGDATSNALLQAVLPKVAVISTSTEEKASTPAARVLTALRSCGAEIWQTQDTEVGVLITLRDGEITVEQK